MLVYNGTPQQQEYFDTCITNAIPIIRCLSLNDIQELRVMVNKHNAEILSAISNTSKSISIMLHNFTNIQQGVNIPEMQKSILDFKFASLDASAIDRLQTKINSIVSALQNIRISIEQMYSIPIGSLSLYTYDDLEAGIDFSVEKNRVPIVLAFYEGRIVLKNIISLVQMFLSSGKDYNTKRSTLSSTLQDKPNKALLQYKDILRQQISESQSVEQLSDACFLAMITYTDCHLVSRTAVDIFVNRKYDLIREDIRKESQKYF
jgi:hypothetical protein